jgi:hypothetical protein
VEDGPVDHETGVLDQRDVLVNEGVLFAVDTDVETGDVRGVAVADRVDSGAEVPELAGDRRSSPEG